ncbi:DNA oxidative demethylase AlkB [Rouxiella sp. Mn2063]|uniref:DNA oxidative demethylase AlkB n=1 Tax=Rouxiella sp. Mn2063 TaxID=3395262 RepID=UPI003BBACD4A
MIEDLFADDDSVPRQWQESLTPGAVILRGFVLDTAPVLLQQIDAIASCAPFRHLVTPGGHVMSVGMTNCGLLGWVSDELGYRYSGIDPVSQAPWPLMPDIFRQLAVEAAAVAGFANFNPDACLINCYQPGSRLTLHQDKNERDFSQPIVSVSLGLPATFLFGGLQREDVCQRFPLVHGDVMVWGGPSRLRYHAVLPLKEGIPPWPLRDAVRYNLTFRRVLAA